MTPRPDPDRDRFQKTNPHPLFPPVRTDRIQNRAHQDRQTTARDGESWEDVGSQKRQRKERIRRKERNREGQEWRKPRQES